MTVRWVISHLENLPYESRISKYFNDDDFTYNEHLLADAVDCLSQNLYFTSLGAAAQVGKDFQKYARKCPKPIERPKVRPQPKQKRVFTSAKVLQQKLAGGFKEDVKAKVKRELETRRLLGGE